MNSSPTATLAAAVARVTEDTRSEELDPGRTPREAVDATRRHLDLGDVRTLVRDGVMSRELAAAYRAVISADPVSLDAAVRHPGADVVVTDLGVAMETAGEQPVERAGGVETVAVVEHADAAVACAAAAASAAQAAADAHAAGDLDAVGVVIVEDLRAECDADAY